MGLIKTAMISGVALYGVNKLAKGAGQYHNAQPRSQPQRDQSRSRQYENQSDGQAPGYSTYYEDPQSSGRRQPRALPDHYAYEPANFDNGYTEPKVAYVEEPIRRRAPGDEPQYAPQQSGAWSSGAPPQYHRVPAKQGYVEREEVLQTSSRGASSSKSTEIRALSQQMMEFAQSRVGESGQIGKDQLQEFLSGLVKK